MTRGTTAKRGRKGAARWIGRGGAGLVAAALIVAGLNAAGLAPAQALSVDQSLPTWADVEAAKQNQAAAAAKVTEIEGILKQVEAEVETTRAASADAAAKYQQASEDFQAAAQRADTLSAQAAKSRDEANAASDQAAALVSQMYRSGGIDRSLQLFLETDGDTSEQLLERLASMSRATERNTTVAEEAERAMNTADSLGKQAGEAAAERDRLKQEADAKQQQAAAEAETARQKLVEQEATAATLRTQLDALKDKTTTTTAGYQERERQQAAYDAEQRRLAEEAARKAAEEAANNGGGGGGGTPPVNSGGWMVPVSGYWISDVWGAGRGHLGIDLAVGAGTPIRAAGSGTVTFSGWWPYCGGYMVEISHGGGFQTWYAHQNGPPIVGNGQWVNVGQVIGYVGATGCATGPHLHFATLQNGTFVEPQGAMAQRGIWF